RSMGPQTKRILIVDDEASQRQSLAQLLRLDGYEIDEAVSGAAALEQQRSQSFSVLITDLRLPGINGLEVIRRARELDNELGILLVTAYASVESAIEALRLGAHDYLIKPLIHE